MNSRLSKLRLETSFLPTSLGSNCSGCWAASSASSSWYFCLFLAIPSLVKRAWTVSLTPLVLASGGPGCCPSITETALITGPQYDGLFDLSA